MYSAVSSYYIFLSTNGKVIAIRDTLVTLFFRIAKLFKIRNEGS